MKKNRTILVAALAVLANSAADPRATAQETGQIITLDRALELALLNNPQLAQSNASLINAGTTRQRAWGSFLPNLSMSSGSSLNSSQRFDPNTQRIVTGSSTSYSAGLSASYQLFQGGRKFHEMGRTATAYQEAEARLQTQRFSVLLQTRTLFLNALRQADLVNIQEVSLERTQQNHSISLSRFAAGEATQSDTLRTLLDVSNGRQSLLQARNQLRAAQWSLGRQVGMSGPVVPAAPEAGLDPAPLRLSEAEIIALAESASPAVRAAEAASRVAQIGVDNARSSYLPNLSMSTRYNWANQERSFSGGSTSWGLSLSGSYTLFDGFGREASVSQANQTRRVSRLSEEDARRSVRQEVDAALRTLETQVQAIAIAEESVLVAQEDFRIVRLRYQAAQSTILDVIVSQVALEQSEVNLVATRFDYSLAKAELESIIGVEL